MTDGLNPCGDKTSAADNESYANMGRFGPYPAIQKHANRRHGLLYNGGNGARSMRRSQFLYELTEPGFTDRFRVKGKTMFGSSQSLGVLSDPVFGTGYDLTNPDDYPHAWLKKHRSLRVPKCVVISLAPSWTLLWEMCSFMAPDDILQFVEAGLLSTYSYYEQYNTDGPMDSVRFHQRVGFAQNPWFAAYQQCIVAALEAKKILESDKNDPIFVTIPDWLPPSFVMKVRANQYPDIRDSGDFENGLTGNSCTVTTPSSQAFMFPDKDAAANYSSFPYGGVYEILTGAKPFFGTNVLHLYWGHHNQRILTGNAPWQSESWPFSPEVSYFAPSLPETFYLGNDAIPGFAGYRQNWVAHGFNYGPVPGLYNGGFGFHDICGGQANSFKNEFYEYRNFGTKLIVPNGSPQWSPAWGIGAVRNDQLWCKGQEAFWFGEWDWAGFQSAMTANGTGDNEDFYRVDTSSETNLKTYISFSQSPDSPTIRKAMAVGTLISKVVDDYYKSIDPGTFTFWQDMMTATCLPDYGFELIGGSDGDFMLDSGSLVEYIRKYYKDESPS